MKLLPNPISELKEPSEYLQEVLATPPHWVIRWGQFGIFLLVIILLTLSWMIRYPDRISGKLLITTANPPIGIIAKTDGYIIDLLVADHDKVEEGEVLAIIQNPARYEDVVELRMTLQQLNTNNLAGTLADSLVFPIYQLGSMQSNYSQLQTAWSAYEQYQKLRPHYQERLSLERQLIQHQQLLVQKQAEQALLDRKSELIEKDFLRNKQLYTTQSIAEKALEISEQEWIDAKYASQVLASELTQIQLHMSQLIQKQQQLSHQQDQTQTLLQSTLQSALDNQIAALSQWEELYVLKAPISGRISLFDIENANQYVHTQDTVMRIVPDNNQPVLGRLLVPIQNFGKVKVGQKVKVYLDNYPHEEYGTLSAIVEDFSALPQQGCYRMVVSFPEGLKTQYGRVIPAQQYMQGRAEIITEERRLLERVFDKLKAETHIANTLSSN
ncbi:HlyD family secretion protein [Catalinimonas niigatensis]|uniref:HlyD family secretion protein n=1 Tax=Catalinimonas niigatensis TaxID=1397264 RepID=UPI0026671414|nr:HlyD family secretion protein [Catalinimonas niigatensis]WPP51757.1 HlyD family efflux transporter periplasmic adaptor subunit [Catalinimonas niigatensis]